MTIGDVDLGKYGYEKIRKMTVNARHKALRAAAMQRGWQVVHRKLTVMYMAHKNRDPVLARLFRDDAIYARAAIFK